ncbi:hypothetical protein AMAG_01423 [Allomyces macrogynus ATCC 38327]|uniref:Ribonucleotide reductase alpha-helical domain-containing protein n=1 Tax=Allomyces macrogynus (strain ATCC 38327) TaxID=578462 RepID=A0A0L0RYS7_ALLM3|nr:hypothetical protein AMAG_01423 [Allomyces macrogynus ATCC 38327]|eukprot:KNE55537.1 hypothetical protein AMAG_01423 [Allomyces macrogynus ATCC 38327]
MRTATHPHAHAHPHAHHQPNMHAYGAPVTPGSMLGHAPPPPPSLNPGTYHGMYPTQQTPPITPQRHGTADTYSMPGSSSAEPTPTAVGRSGGLSRTPTATLPPPPPPATQPSVSLTNAPPPSSVSRAASAGAASTASVSPTAPMPNTLPHPPPQQPQRSASTANMMMNPVVMAAATAILAARGGSLRGAAPQAAQPPPPAHDAAGAAAPPPPQPPAFPGVTPGNMAAMSAAAAAYASVPPSFGFDGLGELVYYRTYSRLKPNGENEQWYETVARVVNGTFNLQRQWIEHHHLGWDACKAQAPGQSMSVRIFHMKFSPPRQMHLAQVSLQSEQQVLSSAVNTGGATYTSQQTETMTAASVAALLTRSYCTLFFLTLLLTCFPTLACFVSPLTSE